MTGIATPSETAIVAAIYAFVVGAFIYRELPIPRVPKILIDSAVSSAGILDLVRFANVFGSILSAECIPQMIVGAVLSITDNKYLINILLLFVGMFTETIAALIILFVPYRSPAAGPLNPNIRFCMPPQWCAEEMSKPAQDFRVANVMGPMVTPCIPTAKAAAELQALRLLGSRACFIAVSIIAPIRIIVKMEHCEKFYGIICIHGCFANTPDGDARAWRNTRICG